MKIFDCVKHKYEFRKPLYIDNGGRLILGRYAQNKKVRLLRYDDKKYSRIGTIKNVCNSDDGTFIVSTEYPNVIFIRRKGRSYDVFEYGIESKVERLLATLEVETEYLYENAFNTNHFIVLVFHDFNVKSYLLHIINKESNEIITISMLCYEPQISINEVNIENDLWFIIQGKFILPENDIRNFYCTNVYMISFEEIKINKKIDIEKFEILKSYKYKYYLMQDGHKLYFAINTDYLKQTIFMFDLYNQKIKGVLNTSNVLFIGPHNNDYYYQDVICEETHIRGVVNKDFDIHIKDNIKQSVYKVTQQHIIFSNLPFRGNVIIYDYISNNIVYEKNFDKVEIPVQIKYFFKEDELVIY